MRGGEGRGETYFTTCGAMTLQGPHQVAKASRTTILLSLRADWNSALLHGKHVSNNPASTRTTTSASRGKRAGSRSERERTHTYLDRLWTPILTADCLNALTKFCLQTAVFVLILSAVVAYCVEDLKKSDINFRGGRVSFK